MCVALCKKIIIISTVSVHRMSTESSSLHDGGGIFCWPSFHADSFLPRDAMLARY